MVAGVPALSATHMARKTSGLLAVVTKFNSGGLIQLVMNISTPENFPLYGMCFQSNVTFGLAHVTMPSTKNLEFFSIYEERTRFS